MSDFMGFREPTHIDTSFNQRPIEDYYSPNAIARDHRTSRQSGQSHGRVRDVTWISTSQNTSQLPSASIYPPSTDPQVYPGPPPPPQPIPGMPTPVIGGHSNIPPSDSDWDAEYMTVDADMDPDEGYGYGYSEQSKRRGGAKTFVGGFVSGLKKLPKAMSKGRLHDRKAVRHDTTGTMGTSQTMLTVANNLTTSTLPQYQSSQTHGEPPNVQYVEASRMPVEEPAPPPQHTPRDRRERSILSAVHEHSLNSHHSHHSRHSPHSHLSNPYDHHHEHSNSNSGDDTQSQDTSTSNNADIRRPSAEADLSPVFVEPLPSADFAGVNPPIRLAPNSDSLRHQFHRVQRFLHEVNDLPWVASPAVSVEYIPGEANRKRYSRQKDTRVHTSWYKPTDNRPLDLLAGSSSTRILPQHVHHTTGHIHGSSASLAYATAPAGRSRSPTANGQGPPSRGGSSEGHGYPVYPTYPQFLSPGAMFVYPQSPPLPGGHSSSGSIPRGPEMQQALPVFMVAPHPPFMSPPPPETGRYSPYGYQVPQVQHA